MVSSANPQPPESQNPFAAPQFQDVSGSVGTAWDPERNELATFVGSKAGYYLTRWKNGLTGGFGFNWAAFFFAGFWLSYRKMYRLTVILFGSLLLLSVVEAVVFELLLGYPETPGGIDLFVGIGVGILCGSQGNAWYLRHAKQIIADVRERTPEGPARMQVLKQRGGTSILAALGILFIYFVAEFVIALVVGGLLEQFGADPMP